MRVLIYSINYLPELTGIGKYNGEMATWLVEKGHEVRVITTPPYYPQWKVHKGYHQFQYKRELLEGVRVWRCPVWVPSRLSGVMRMLHLLSFATSSLPVLCLQMFWKPDIVIVLEPPLFCSPAALFLTRLAKVKSWLHVQDFEVDAAFELGLLKSDRLKNLVLIFECWLMGKFDKVSTISDQMMERLKLKRVALEKQVLFPNWVDTTYIYPVVPKYNYRELLGIPASNIVFLYAGNMGEKQGLEIIIDAARNLSSNDAVSFVMCGHGSAYQRLSDLAYGLKNIYWLDLQPLDKLNDLLNTADVHLLPQREDAADLVMPSKLTGMMSSGKPVLATANTGTQIACALENAGVVVPPGDLQAFVRAISELINDKELRKLMGNNARKYAVDRLSQDAILNAFELKIYDLIDEGK